ncbi:coiled-coil domain-containing protein [Catellatospora vulcania]
MLLAAVFLVVSGLSPAAPAFAEPNEGNSKTLAKLRENLDAAAKGYLEAQAELEAAQASQKALAAELTAAESELEQLRVFVGQYAAEAYKTGRLGMVSLMINGTSPGSLLTKANAMDRMTQRDEARLNDYRTHKQEITAKKAAIDIQLKLQQDAVKNMEKRKKAADAALRAVDGRDSTGYINPNSPLAKPAPRNANGSWPSESCSVNDPTTSGCITPRTLWAMNQAKANGFKRYVSCHRSGGGGEHPKGRACDFASATGGFTNYSASGGDRTYGNNLASFFIKNASRLGVMYVIWYCKIWINGGWKTYDSAGSNCGDNPAGDHTNHVHLSML